MGLKSYFDVSLAVAVEAKLAAASDDEVFKRAVFAVDRDFRHSGKGFLTGYDVPENSVFHVQMGTWCKRDEESRPA